MRMLTTKALLSVVLTIAAGYAFGHWEYRVIGTLTKHDNSMIEVATRDGDTRSIKLDGETQISRDGNDVDAEALQPGISVVVDALGDTLNDLLALEIRIVPPIEN